MIARYGGKLDEKTVRAELEGNICRCTGYHNIVKAILAAAAEMSGSAKVAPNRSERSSAAGRRATWRARGSLKTSVKAVSAKKREETHGN
jgi:xanthine dehydrogenase iron-sulfur cluster and FAD-binding subunit A